LLVEPGALSRALDLAAFDAIIVMSHHLASDRKYLAEVASTDARYLGVLGPRARRKRLLADLGESTPGLDARLRGPVGIDIGADSPSRSRFSILADLQATLSGVKSQ
jgi:xanthine/CO dehydrogenase XdhC/CoxF family maturation factor